MKKTGFTHDNVNNKTVDWYTPKWIFDELGLHTSPKVQCVQFANTKTTIALNLNSQK